MMTLTQLRALAGAQFPGVHASLAHLLVAWGRADPDGALAALLAPCGLTPARFAEALTPWLDPPAAEDKALLLDSIQAVTGEVTGRHLLRAVCAHPAHRLSRALRAAGLDGERLAQTLEEPPAAPAPATPLAALGIRLDPRAASPLLRYGRDLTALAAEGAFAELAPRPAEQEQLLDVLLRKRKGNPLLVGPAGVGKTALVELLAATLVQEPRHPLAGYRLYEISLGKLVAGTQYRGDFEARVEEVFAALQAVKTAILFLDEIHLLLGVGRAEGAAMDGANLLKPLLVREAFRVIGATTPAEYQRYIARDEALARRFQVLRLAEPGAATVLAMVQSQVAMLARHHGLAIPDALIRQAIALTERHLPNRHQPDKTVDLLDSAAVVARRREASQLNKEDLLATLARFTGTPIGVLTGEGRQALRNLARALEARVIGQDAAIERVVAALVHRRLDLGNPERPLGVFLFAGDTGVGKTELARAIAAAFLGDSRKLVQLDLGEYTRESDKQKLIGAPPGYIGSDDEGVLIRALQTHPSAVLLFDEIEKAHPEVHQLLLGLLDEGRVTSARGELFSARQCVIVLTTNALTARDLERQPIGFRAEAVPAADAAELLGQTFPREFLGRFDEIVPFNRLTPQNLRAILKLRLKEQEAQLARKGLRLRYAEDRLLDHLLAKLELGRSGARGLARVLERHLVQPLALALLEAEEGGETRVVLGEAFYAEGTVTVAEVRPTADSAHPVPAVAHRGT